MQEETEDKTYGVNEATAETIDPDKLNTVDGPRSGLTDWKHEPTITDIKADLEYARQENTEQKSNVEGWLALRNATGAESGVKTKKPGRSSVQPKLIRKINEWRYPALSEPFLNSDRMFKINPRTFEDENAAKQNELVLNWQFDTKIDKVDFIDRVVRKVVDEGTVIIRIGWERKTEIVKVEKPVYEYLPLDINDPEDAEGLQMLAMATELFMEDPEQFADTTEIPENLKAAVEYSAENETPVMANETGTEWVDEVRISVNRPSLKIVNVANFFIDPSCEGNWREAQYMIHTYEATKSDLKMRKIYKNLDKVSWTTNAVKAQGGDQDHETTTPIHDARVGSDKTKVLVYEYWGLFDIRGDGVMVPVVVTFIGDTIIQMTDNPFPDRKPPFILIPYMPIDGSNFGEADASILQDNQRILGAVTRGHIDLLGRSANAQIGYAKGFLDPVNRRRFNSGEDFEYNPNSDPARAIQQMKYPELSQSGLVIAQQQNAEAEGLTGVKSFSGGITGEAYGQVARGISGALDAAGQREMSILRRIAEGVRQIGTKIISMNAHFLEDKEVVRVTNREYVEVDRNELGGNFDMIVDISTAQVDEAKAQDLGFMLQTQGPNMDPGLEQIILSEIADLKRMPGLAERIRSFKPEPDPMQVKIQELQIALLEAQVANEQSKAKKNNAEAMATEVDAAMEADGTKHQRNVEASGAQARGNRDLEVTKSILEGAAAPQQIEAAVGYNKLTEETDRMQAKPTSPAPPAQLAPQGPIGMPQDQPLALPQ